MLLGGAKTSPAPLQEREGGEPSPELPFRDGTWYPLRGLARREFNMKVVDEVPKALLFPKTNKTHKPCMLPHAIMRYAKYVPSVASGLKGGS